MCRPFAFKSGGGGGGGGGVGGRGGAAKYLTAARTRITLYWYWCAVEN